jgi:hypothetical protein
MDNNCLPKEGKGPKVQIFEKTTKSERGTAFIVIGGCTRYIGEKNTLMYLEGFLCMVNDETLKFKPRGVNG